MTLRTHLDMDAIRAEVKAELAQMRAKGVPMVSVESGRVIQETLVNGVIEKKDITREK